jgi:hypothetical protein
MTIQEVSSIKMKNYIGERGGGGERELALDEGEGHVIVQGWATVVKRSSRSESQSCGTTQGPTALPCSGQLSRYATSYSVGAISPHESWNV